MKALDFLMDSFYGNYCLPINLHLHYSGVHYLNLEPGAGVWLFSGANPETCEPMLKVVVGNKGKMIPLGFRRTLGTSGARILYLVDEVDLGFAKISPFLQIKELELVIGGWENILRKAIAITSNDLTTPCPEPEMPPQSDLYSLEHLFGGVTEFQLPEVPAPKDYGNWVSIRRKFGFWIFTYIKDDQTQGVCITHGKKSLVNTYFYSDSLDSFLKDPDRFWEEYNKTPKTAPALADLVLKYFEPALLI